MRYVLMCVVAMALMLATAPAHGQYDADAVATCAAIGDVADGIMDARYAGVAVTDVLRALWDVADAQEGVSEGDKQEQFTLWSAMVYDIYDLPWFYGEDARATQRVQFRNEIERWCLETW